MKFIGFFVFVGLVQPIQAMVVHDPVNYGQLVQQLEALREQAQQIKEQTQLLKGNKGFGSIGYDAQLNTYLPKSGDGVIDVYQHGRSDIARLREDILEQSKNDKEKEFNQRRYRQAATQKAVALKAYEGSEARIRSLESLMYQIKNTQDPKATAELQARIQVEQALLENESNKLKLMSMLQRAEEDLLEEQENAYHEQVFNPENTNMPRIK
jgi:type IV secretion system protein VirB5